MNVDDFEWRRERSATGQLFVVADVFVGLCEEEESERVAKFGGIVVTVVLVVWQSRSGQEK